MNKLILLACLMCFTVLVSLATGPVITGFSPASGAVGSSVTITGSGFNTTAAQNFVLFGSTQATVTAANATSITVTVPAQSTYQPISVTDLSNNLTAWSAAPFDVTFTGGGFAFAPRQNFGAGYSPYNIELSDVDGDGLTDLILSDFYTDAFYVLRNTCTAGNLSFQLDTFKIGDPNGGGTYSQAAGDLDGDGKPDVVIVMDGLNTVAVRRNTSTPGSVSFAAQDTFTTGFFSYFVTIGDVDGDGKADLIVKINNGNSIEILRNTSTPGAISFAAPVMFSPGSTFPVKTSIVIADIDGDGKVDLVASQDSICVLINTSTPGSISFASPAYIPGSMQQVADIDGDGKADLVGVNSDSTASVYRNLSSIGSASFAPAVNFPLLRGNGVVAIGDINGDGKPDLAISDPDVNAVNSNTLSILKNTSTPGAISFAAQDTFSAGVVASFLGIADFDGDGKPDVALVENNDDVVSIYRQIPDTSTAIQNLSNDVHLSLYPNPTDNNLAILCEQSIQQIDVMDISGQLVLSGRFNQSQVTMPFSNLSNGMYILKIYLINGELNRLVVKN